VKLAVSAAVSALDEIEVGREMDVRVAEAMGWTVDRWEVQRDVGAVVGVMFSMRRESVADQAAVRINPEVRSLPEFSTDDAAALEVLHEWRMSGGGRNSRYVEVSYEPHHAWAARFVEVGDDLADPARIDVEIEKCSSFAEVVCRARLKAGRS
jgi:hypothetical protein